MTLQEVPPSLAGPLKPPTDRTQEMSLTQLVARFDRWLDRVIQTDERVICAACDDRFHSRALGVEHVLRCHPEYQGVVVYDEAPAPAPTPVAPARPAWSPVPGGLTAVPVHVRSF